jgi:TolB-like protein
LQTIGKELGVSAVVTGRVLKRGDTLIVQTELVETQRGSQLWGQQYWKGASMLQQSVRGIQRISQHGLLRKSIDTRFNLDSRR